jgi:hypothetical protein
MVELKFPVVDGLKRTLTTQDAEGAREAPQVLDEMANREACAPLMDMFDIEKLAVPVFFKVVESGLEVVPAVWLPKDKLAGVRLAMPCAPVPVNGTVCGLPTALSETLTVADSAPIVEGAKFTVMVQEAAGIIGDAQLFVWENIEGFVPVMVIPDMVRLAPPGFVSVVESWLDPLTCTLPKARLVGENWIAGRVPVPDSGMVCGARGALSMKVILAGREPEN